MYALSQFLAVVRFVKPNTCKENRAFVGRPLGERNPSFGVQQFVSLHEMKEGGFVRDDVVFVKITVDNTDFLQP